MNNYFQRTSQHYVNFDTFNPNEFFAEYHLYRVFNANATYYKFSDFDTDYGKGHGMRHYVNTLHICDDLSLGTQKLFVVAEEILDTNDKKIYLPYCNCENHSSSWLNPMSYFANNDPTCINNTPLQKNINQARTKFEESQKILSTTWF